VASLSTTTLSIRIRRELKEKMRELKEVDWRVEIEKFIEEKIREIELSKTLKLIEEALANVSISSEPAWKTIKKFRVER